MKSDFVCLVKLALKIDVRVRLGQLVLRGDQVSVEIVETECLLKLIVSSIRCRFRIDSESLIKTVNNWCVRLGLVVTYLTEVFQILLLICLSNSIPSILRRHVRDSRRVKNAVGRALRSLMSWTQCQEQERDRMEAMMRYLLACS